MCTYVFVGIDLSFGIAMVSEWDGDNSSANRMSIKRTWQSVTRNSMHWLDKGHFAPDEKEGLIKENEKWQQNDDGNVSSKQCTHLNCI